MVPTIMTSQPAISDDSSSRLYVPKKARNDFYKALQALDFHTVQVRDQLGACVLPDKEAGTVLAYMESLQDRLTLVHQKISEHFSKSMPS